MWIQLWVIIRELEMYFKGHSFVSGNKQRWDTFWRIWRISSKNHWNPPIFLPAKNLDQPKLIPSKFDYSLKLQKYWVEIEEESGNIYEKAGKRILGTPLINILYTLLCNNVIYALDLSYQRPLQSYLEGRSEESSKGYWLRCFRKTFSWSLCKMADLW